MQTPEQVTLGDWSQENSINLASSKTSLMETKIYTVNSKMAAWQRAQRRHYNCVQQSPYKQSRQRQQLRNMCRRWPENYAKRMYYHTITDNTLPKEIKEQH